jgi:hypothetical protein
MSFSGDVGHCMDARLPSWECGDKMPHSHGGPLQGWLASCGAQSDNDMYRQISTMGLRSILEASTCHHWECEGATQYSQG